MKIIKYTKFLIMPLIIISMLILADPTISNTLEEINGDNGNNPLQIVIEPSDENNSLKQEEKSINELNMDDLFGSEQVFPFEPGFS